MSRILTLATLTLVFTLATAQPAWAGACPSKEFRELTVKQMRKAAEKGCVEAMEQLQMANHITRGETDVRFTSAERWPWLQRCAEGGDAECQLRLAWFLTWGVAFERGFTIPRDEARALQLVDAAIASGKLPASHYSLTAAKKLASDLRAAPGWRKAAEAGDPAAQFSLAMLYSNFGAGVWTLNEGGPLPEYQPLFDAALKAAYLPALEHQRKIFPQDQPVRYTTGIALSEVHGRTDDDAWIAEYAINTAKDVNVAQRFFARLDQRKAPGAHAMHLLLDDPRTRALIQSALQDNNADAAWDIAQRFDTAGAPTADRTRAIAWYRRAMDAGHVEAAWRVGTMTGDESAMYTASGRGHAQARAWADKANAQKAQAAVEREKQMREADARGRIEARQRAAEYRDRVDREGPRDAYDVEMYCLYGGSRCQALRAAAIQNEKRNNAAAAAYNAQRLQNVYNKSSGQSDAAYRARSECLQRKTQAIQNNTKGQADYFNQDCNAP